MSKVKARKLKTVAPDRFEVAVPIYVRATDAKRAESAAAVLSTITVILGRGKDLIVLSAFEGKR